MVGSGIFNLNGLRRITLTIAVLALLFSGFFWLGYWTGVGHTLMKRRIPVTVIPPEDLPDSAPVHKVEDTEEPVWL